MDAPWEDAVRRLTETQAALSRELEALRAVSDRQQIYDCTLRFCRGVNRRDYQLLRSAFHPDAIDDHGAFVGDREQFLEWIDQVYERVAHTQHYIMNQTIELDGDIAHGETYWLVCNIYKGSPAVILRGGRYIDRFERRQAHWAIARRVCLTEWHAAPGEIALAPEIQAMKAQSGISAMDTSDLSYQRPLEITRASRSFSPHGREPPT